MLPVESNFTSCAVNLSKIFGSAFVEIASFGNVIRMNSEDGENMIL